MRSTPDTRTLFKADAGFEAALGIVLVLGTGVAWFTGSDFTVPTAIVTGAGVAFLLASASQISYFINSPRRVLLELAVGNAGMALAGVIWLIAARGFSTTGAVILSIAIAWKLAISSLQLRSLTGPRIRLR
jgi:hypothetical protein